MVAEVSFYHVEGDTPAVLDKVLPPLVEKMLGAGHKVGLCTPNLARAQRLSEFFWTYAEASFLPHDVWGGSAPMGEQPLLLVGVENAVEGALLEALDGRLPLLLAGAEGVLPLLMDKERVAYVFSSHASHVDVARGLWKDLKGQGALVTYWQQTGGRWGKKG